MTNDYDCTFGFTNNKAKVKRENNFVDGVGQFSLGKNACMYACREVQLHKKYNHNLKPIYISYKAD